MLTVGQKALAIATAVGPSLVFVGIGLALASGVLLLSAVGFAALSALFVVRLLRV